MVVLNRIYTRTGDDGTTALGTGERVAKFDARVTAYGTVDETNAAIGMVQVHLAGAPIGPEANMARRIGEMLTSIQNDLFDLGADLCVPERGEKPSYEPLRITDGQVERLERDIDSLNAALSPLRSFVLPGGTAAAAALHVARTVCRRAERLVVELSLMPAEPVNPAALRYLNRLSDFLFVASRAANDQGARDVLWVPGKNR